VVKYETFNYFFFINTTFAPQFKADKPKEWSYIEVVDRYPYFFEETFLNEGYYQNLKSDKGNWYKGKLYGTICGIAAKYHFKEYQEAYYLYKTGKYEALKLYAMGFYKKKGYWDDRMNDLADSSLAYKLYDFGVNADPRTATKLLQITLNKYYNAKLKQDGLLGNQTISEANVAYHRPVWETIPTYSGESLLYSAYVYELKKWYEKRSNFWIFKGVWIRRLKKIFNKLPDNLDLVIEALPPERI